MTKYIDYFNVESDYYPQATEELIKNGSIDWKKFYPHETFIQLVKDAIRVISRQPKLSLWVEGSYGTGKSHAVLTLQKLLEVSNEETRNYFDQFKVLKESETLLSDLERIKKQGKIITVQRFGSSDINNDNDLVFAIQESIFKSLKENGCNYLGETLLKRAVIEFLSVEYNKIWFNTIIEQEYKHIFEGDNVDDIIENLNKLTGIRLSTLMSKIMRIGNEKRLPAFTLNIDELINWIKDVIDKNDLKAIFFIWDEFNEYFDNNKRHLTGFQKLVEITSSTFFYLCIVTHKSGSLFDDNNSDKRKILGRFVEPTCVIELPQNMAFRLIGQSFEINSDSTIAEAWKSRSEDLNRRLTNCRKKIISSTNIIEEELKGVIPIHPYTALVLKQISTTFDSNQRSMFDFLKNDRGEELKGFQWYINNFGPEDDECFLTIDMLWDFFYEKGKNNLEDSIRIILDGFGSKNVEALNVDERKVFKTILLLQAISQKLGESVENLIPNDENLSYAYEGTNLDNDKAKSIAKKLVKEGYLYLRTMGLNQAQYSSIIANRDTAVIEGIRKDLEKEIKTRDLIKEINDENIFDLSESLKLRYEVKYATVDDFKIRVKELIIATENKTNKIPLLATFVKNESENVTIKNMIDLQLKEKDNVISFLDTSEIPFSNESFGKYIENLANSKAMQKSDINSSIAHAKFAEQLIKQWYSKIKKNDIYFYDNNHKNGICLLNLDEVQKELVKSACEKFPYGIEQFPNFEILYTSSYFKLGAECGIKEELIKCYINKKNPKMSLESALEGAWGIENYYLNADSTFKNVCIKRIKSEVNELINNMFNQHGKVSILDIYDLLSKEPFGFMPCNLTSFILGFVLKEYAFDSYGCSDDLTTNPMDIEALTNMINEMLKYKNYSSAKYNEKFIVKMTDEEKKFLEVTSKAFNISAIKCTSITQARTNMRIKTNEYYFPILFLKNITSVDQFCCNPELINHVIDDYAGLANSENNLNNKTESDFAMSIGKKCIENKDLMDDLCQLITVENCKRGMKAYLSKYDAGKLIEMAKTLELDENIYLSNIKEKCDAREANWLWNLETVNYSIDSVILDFQIIIESNGITSSSKSFDEMIEAWRKKLNLIKISYETIPDADLTGIMRILFDIMKEFILKENNKENFLLLLRQNKSKLTYFFQHQQEYFEKIFKDDLNKFSPTEITEIIDLIPDGIFIKERENYYSIVKDTIKVFDNTLLKSKLLKKWNEKTNTSTPREWSKKFEMPIICMVPDLEKEQAKKSFDILNGQVANENEYSDAITYLDNANFFNELNQEKIREETFIKCIIMDRKQVLDNVDEVKKQLINKLGLEPYDWYKNYEVDEALTKFAKLKYEKDKKYIAKELVDNLDNEAIKKYLKEFVENYFEIGMRILNTEKEE
ncbi:MAG: hypothetical protein RSC93_08765 [Erysipelotrichaceae bacterium]